MRIEPGEMAHVGDNWEFDFLTAEESGIKAFYLDRKGSRGGSEVIGNLGELLSLTGLL
jgi:FMN phosphatase YigB (HAD superfamily)